MNTHYLGDKLKILRENIKGESVDLVYLDPPHRGFHTTPIFGWKRGALYG